MTQDYPKPIAPPPELVQEWYHEANLSGVPYEETAENWAYEQHIANRAAQWGADHELLAAGNYLKHAAAWEEEDITEFYNYRRPRPKSSSLKELALAVLENEPEADDMKELVVFDVDQVEIIRRALEELPE